jgi:hypothetical protein
MHAYFRATVGQPNRWSILIAQGLLEKIIQYLSVLTREADRLNELEDRHIFVNSGK